MKPCFNESTTMRRGCLETDIPMCAKYGFEVMEIREDKLLDFLKRHTLGDLRALLKEYNITPTTINAVHEINFRDYEGWLQTKELCEFLFYAGREIGCYDLEVVPSQNVIGKSEEEIRDETAKSLLLLSDIARHYNARCSFEFIGFKNFTVNTFNQTLDIINLVNRDNVGILLDTFHFYALGGDPADLLKARADQIYDVHLGDCIPRAPGEAVRADRLWPGDGGVPLVEILQNLKTIGYDGPVAVEMFRPEIWDLPYEEGFRLAKEKTVEVMRRAGVL